MHTCVILLKIIIQSVTIRKGVLWMYIGFAWIRYGCFGVCNGFGIESLGIGMDL